MTLRANARLAGLTFLLYFVAGIGGMVVFNQASAGRDGRQAREHRPARDSRARERAGAVGRDPL